MSVTQTLVSRVQLWYNPIYGENPSNTPSFGKYPTQYGSTLQDAYEFTKRQRDNVFDHFLLSDKEEYTGPVHIANEYFAGNQYAEYSMPLLKQSDHVQVLKQSGGHNIDLQRPSNSNVSDQFWLELYGYLVPPLTGQYTFGLHGDNKTLIAIDDVPRMRADGGYTSSYSSEGNTFTIHLEKNRYHTLRIFLDEGGGGSSLSFSWIRPDATSFEVVPATYFSSSAPSVLVPAKPFRFSDVMSVMALRAPVKFSTMRDFFEANTMSSILNSSMTLVTHDGSSPLRAAPSGREVVTTRRRSGISDPESGLGQFWIKTDRMPTPLLMWVDFVEDDGGYDFYYINSNEATYGENNDSIRIDSEYRAKKLGLDVFYPRSPRFWHAFMRFAHITQSKSMFEIHASLGAIYRNQETVGGGDYTGYMFRSEHYNPLKQSTHSVPDWRVPDGGPFWANDDSHGEPNGDYINNAFLGMYDKESQGHSDSSHSHSGPDLRWPYRVGFNDGNSYPIAWNESTGGKVPGGYVASTNTYIPDLKKQFFRMTEPAVCYSLRHYVETYTGPMVTILRGSDDREADVYFDRYGSVRYVLDSQRNIYACLEAFLLGATAYVKTWHDQGGRRNHLDVKGDLLTLEFHKYRYGIRFNGDGFLQERRKTKYMNRASQHVTSLITIIYPGRTRSGGETPFLSMYDSVAKDSALAMVEHFDRGNCYGKACVGTDRSTGPNVSNADNVFSDTWHQISYNFRADGESRGVIGNKDGDFDLSASYINDQSTARNPTRDGFMTRQHEFLPSREQIRDYDSLFIGRTAHHVGVTDTNYSASESYPFHADAYISDCIVYDDDLSVLQRAAVFRDTFFPVVPVVSRKGCMHEYLQLTTRNHMHNKSDFDTYFASAKVLKRAYWPHKIHVRSVGVKTDARIGDSLRARDLAWFDDQDPEEPEKNGRGSGNWFKAYLMVRVSGTYTFGIDSDDASDLLIDDAVVTSYYGGHGMSGDVAQHTGSIELTANKMYKFDARANDHGGEIDGIALGWKTPNDPSWAAVPPDVLTPRSVNVFASALEIRDSTNAYVWASAREIRDATNGTAPDGIYTIRVRSDLTARVYCIIDSAYAGGGWMMALKATRGNTFGYDTSYWTSNNTLNTNSVDQSDADAKFETFNYVEGRDLLARFPDIDSGGSIGGLGAWTWLQNDYAGYVGSRRCTLLHLFTTADRTFIEDAKTFSGYGSAWSSQKDVRFYGFNYTSPYSYARWGFGWNENGGGLFPNGDEGSSDVVGGIGLNSSRDDSVQYSAGDYISCCQDSSGIDRSARVEIYVR